MKKFLIPGLMAAALTGASTAAIAQSTTTTTPDQTQPSQTETMKDSTSGMSGSSTGTSGSSTGTSGSSSGTVTTTNKPDSSGMTTTTTTTTGESGSTTNEPAASGTQATDSEAPASGTTASAPDTGSTKVLTQADGQQWVGKRVHSVDGADIGEVAAMKAGPNGNVQYFHTDIGGFLGIGVTSVQVTPDQLEMRDDKLYLSMTKEEAKKLPSVEDTAGEKN